MTSKFGPAAKDANLANPVDGFAPLATLAVAASDTGRDDGGRFLPGNSGGGRPKGSRNQLTERFLETVTTDFIDHGAEALAVLRIQDPATYLRLVGALVPRALILQREQGQVIDYADLSDDDVTELMKARTRKKMIDQALKT